MNERVGCNIDKDLMGAMTDTDIREALRARGVEVTTDTRTYQEIALQFGISLVRTATESTPAGVQQSRLEV